MTDKTYFDDLVIHLRLRRVPGDEIGALLEEARHHLQVSGESPEEAFGPVEDYARDLAMSTGKGAAPQSWSRREFLLATAHFVSWYLMMGAIVAWSIGEPAQVTMGMTIGVLLGLLLAAKVVWPSLVAYATRKQGLGITLLTTVGPVAITALVVSLGDRFFWSGRVLLSAPATVMVVVSLVLVLASLIPLVRRADPVTRPEA